ncbi:hypothetical protein HK097_007151 [Rhizophlyctis rosea]|uniref:Uncharacterized protein n=1 Tax=Rhizophlyctis rosea TaxID=64517 RepID=A0AAD5X639_9FUNG|nr:hypothetical protein HK097_007151 [Rhizophlyctis rosea]
MSTLTDISIPKMNPILAFTTSINVLLIVLTIYRLITLHRAWRNDGVRTPFRRYVLLVLYTYLLSQSVGVIGRVLQACKRDADNVLNGKTVGDGTGMMCGVVNEGWDVMRGTGNAWGILTAVLWITTDVLTFTSGMFYLFTIFERFLVFRSILQFNHRLVPALRIGAVFLWLYGTLSDVLQSFFKQPKGLSLFFIIGIAFFWLYLILCDIFISVVMLRAFIRINTTFRAIPTPTPSGSHSHSNGGRRSEDREGKEGLDRGMREGRKLTGMLVGLIVLDFCAIGTHITTFWNKTFHVEMGQLATAWVGMHYFVAVMFLSRLKNTMTGRSLGGSSDDRSGAGEGSQLGSR